MKTERIFVTFFLYLMREKTSQNANNNNKIKIFNNNFSYFITIKDNKKAKKTNKN